MGSVGKIFKRLEVPKESKKIFDEIVKQKIVAGERINIYFPFNYSHPNYYFLSQIFYLSSFGRFKNVHLYVSFADTIVAAKGHSLFPAPLREHNESIISSKISEIESLLIYFGFPQERLHIYKATDNWIRLARLPTEKIRRFYIGMSVLPESAMLVPKKTSSLYYLPEKSRYLLVLAIQKYLDLFVAFNFNALFPEETPQGIDIIFLGHYSAPITFNLKKLMEQEGLILGDSPIIVLPPKIPCFGHNMLIDKRFVIPDWDMKVEEIYRIVDKYNVSSDDIKQIFENFLLNTQEFIGLQKNRLPAAEGLSKLESYSFNDQKKVLALNIFDFLQRVKKNCTLSSKKQYLYLNKSENIKDLAKLLRSNQVLQVLALSTGEYTVTEISKKLDKHVSNTSSIIRQLKNKNLVEVSPNKKVSKVVKTIKIDL